MGCKKEFIMDNYWGNQAYCVCGARIKTNHESVFIIAIYNHTSVNNIRKIIEPRIEELINHKLIIMGDWNARIGKTAERSL